MFLSSLRSCLRYGFRTVWSIPLVGGGNAGRYSCGLTIASMLVLAEPVSLFFLLVDFFVPFSLLALLFLLLSGTPSEGMNHGRNEVGMDTTVVGYSTWRTDHAALLLTPQKWSHSEPSWALPRRRCHLFCCCVLGCFIYFFSFFLVSVVGKGAMMTVWTPLSSEPVSK